PGDWTNEILADIRELYGRYSDSQGATRVNLQGVIFDTNGGGRLPIEKYLAATIAERQDLINGTKRIEEVARQHGLSPKYLEALWKRLRFDEATQLIDELRDEWRTAKIEQVPALVAKIQAWQNALTRFQ